MPGSGECGHLQNLEDPATFDLPQAQAQQNTGRMWCGLRETSSRAIALRVLVSHAANFRRLGQILKYRCAQPLTNLPAPFVQVFPWSGCGQALA